MKERKTYILTQYREGSEYNDFIGKYYHFPRYYNNQFKNLPIEFIYYEPIKNGKGEYFGCGRITKVFQDKKDQNFFFAEIEDYKIFSEPVSYRNKVGELLEEKSPFYNPQNAIRKIPLELFDEICLDGGVQLIFKADSHLIKVLGEQLIASERVGILELIKNSYDANASKCIVRIENVLSLPEIDESFYNYSKYPGPVIIIEDDGIGMDRNIVEKGC